MVTCEVHRPLSRPAQVLGRIRRKKWKEKAWRPQLFLQIPDLVQERSLSAGIPGSGSLRAGTPLSRQGRGLGRNYSQRTAASFTRQPSSAKDERLCRWALDTRPSLGLEASEGTQAAAAEFQNRVLASQDGITLHKDYCDNSDPGLFMVIGGLAQLFIGN